MRIKKKTQQKTTAVKKLGTDNANLKSSKKKNRGSDDAN